MSVSFWFADVFLTQDHGDGLHQVEHRLPVSHLGGVLRHLLALVLHVEKDPGVDGQHDGERQQVETSPEHQVAAAVQRRHGGAVYQVAQAVPAHGGNQAHDDGHHPDEQHDDENAPRAHLTVQLHVEDGLVALHRHGQEVEDRRRQAGVDQPLSHKPLVLGQLNGPGTGMKHQVEVGDTWEEESEGLIPEIFYTLMSSGEADEIIFLLTDTGTNPRVSVPCLSTQYDGAEISSAPRFSRNACYGLNHCM